MNLKSLTLFIFLLGFKISTNLELPRACGVFGRIGISTKCDYFDKLGTGLSDRTAELSTIEERMEDITAVMDEVSSQGAVLFGRSEGGSVLALFAATYPNRTIALITGVVFIIS